jgi:hypothetical protein
MNSSSRRAVLDLATSKYDMALAVVENSLGQNMNEESVVRLYDVGRIRAEEEDIDDAENDEENEDDGKGFLFLSSYKDFIVYLVRIRYTVQMSVPYRTFFPWYGVLKYYCTLKKMTLFV